MSRQDDLESKARYYERQLDDPYVQDKWVERELLEETRRELREEEDRRRRR